MKQVSNIILAVIVLITSLNMIDFPWEFRFADNKNNYLFVMVLAIVLPFAVLLWSIFRDSKSTKVVGTLISVCLFAPCYIVFIYANSDYTEIKNKGVDYAFKEINRLQNKHNRYVLYRTNGGATTSFGLVLRLEKEVAFGLIVVNVIYTKYKASKSTLEFIGTNQIKMKIQPYDKNDKVEVVVLSI